MVVPAAAGGTTDIVARLAGQELTKDLGQQVIVDNKGGASGNIGIRTVARAEPDGYTLLMTFSGYQVTNPSLFKKLEWDPLKSFVPVGLVAKAPFLIIARTSRPAPCPSSSRMRRRGLANSPMPPRARARSSISAPSCSSGTGTRMVHVPYKVRVPP